MAVGTSTSGEHTAPCDRSAFPPAARPAVVSALLLLIRCCQEKVLRVQTGAATSLCLHGWKAECTVMLVQHWTTINGVPLARRMQTAAVGSFVGALPLTGICFGATGYMLMKRPLAPLAALYLLYIIFLDKAQKNGRKKSFWFRNLTWWRNFKDFFPISLHRTAPLDPDGRYIFGYHPHGIIGFGAISCFATEAHDFTKLFPGIDVYLVTLPINFRIPFLREIYLALGLLDASKETFKTILSRGSGSSIAVVVGGAAESLKSEPGKMDLVIKSRKGFVRQAFLYEASLVPVLGFGETDVFGIIRSARLLRLQQFLQKKLGFAMPLFVGRGIFQVSACSY